MKKLTSIILTAALLAAMLTVFAVPASAEAPDYFYLKNTGESDVTVSFTNPVSNLKYTTDTAAADSWADFDCSGYTLAAGETVYFKRNDNIKLYSTIKCSGDNADIAAGGDIRFLLNEGGNVEQYPDSAFSGFFTGCGALTDISHLTLGGSDTQLNNYCFESMFSGCTGLTTIPEDLLPATSLKPNCYSSMFSSCSNLKNSPYLPAVTLTTNCYQNMFNGCCSLSSVSVAFTAWPPIRFSTPTTGFLPSELNAGVKLKIYCPQSLVIPMNDMGKLTSHTVPSGIIANVEWCTLNKVGSTLSEGNIWIIIAVAAAVIIAGAAALVIGRKKKKPAQE